MPRLRTSGPGATSTLSRPDREELESRVAHIGPGTPPRQVARDLRALAGVIESDARAGRNRQDRTARSLVDRAVAAAARGLGARQADACRGIGEAVIGAFARGLDEIVDEPWQPDEAQRLAEHLMNVVMLEATRVTGEPATADRLVRLRALHAFSREMAGVLAEERLGEPNLREVLRIAVPNLCKLKARLRPAGDWSDPE